MLHVKIREKASNSAQIKLSTWNWNLTHVKIDYGILLMYIDTGI